MARQIENATVVTHYPKAPFGKHAGTYSIETRLGRTYEGEAPDAPPIALSGCALEDPLDEDAKTMLCGLALARIDSGGRFEVDYKALRAHLRTACGVLSEDLSGLTWATIKYLIGPCRSAAGGAATASGEASVPRDDHRRYERPMSKREIGIALGLDADDRKIAEKVDSMMDSWGGQLHKVNRTNYLVPLDVLPKHFMDRFRTYVKDFHRVDL